MLIIGLYTYRTPVEVTELMLMLRSLNLFGGTRRYRRDYGTCTGIADLFLYGSTCKYYGTYTGLTELGHVFQILYMSYRAYTYLTELILILRSIY